MKRKTTGINQLDTPKPVSGTSSPNEKETEQSSSFSKKNDTLTSSSSTSASFSSPGQTTDSRRNTSQTDGTLLEKIKLQDTTLHRSSVSDVGCAVCRARWSSSSSSSSSSFSTNTDGNDPSISISSSSTVSLLRQKINDNDDNTNTSLSCNNRTCSRVSPDSLSRSRQYTKCDVALHCTVEDCWLSAHGRVYDVTAFLHEHPGGRNSILKHAGTDSTLDFDFHSASARKLWTKYEIGILVPCERETNGTCIIC